MKWLLQSIAVQIVLTLATCFFVKYYFVKETCPPGTRKAADYEACQGLIGFNAWDNKGKSVYLERDEGVDDWDSWNIRAECTPEKYGYKNKIKK